MNNLRMIGLIGGALALVPLVVHSQFWLNFGVMVLLFATLGQAWNILGGYGGQFSFGHALFFGIGAYASAVLQVRYGIDPWLALLFGAVLGAGAGAGIGGLCFRYGLRGSYFALVTLAFAEVFRILANVVGFTGAGAGTLIALRQGARNFQFVGHAGFYFVALALVLLSLICALWIERSRFGAWLIAVRENEDAARALGVNAVRVKVAAAALSGALAALGGSFYAQYFLFVDPRIAFGPAISVEILLVPIIGGIGTVFGPLLGAFALQVLAQFTQDAFGGATGINLVLYGACLVAMVLFLPTGLMGLPTAFRRPAHA